MNLYERFLNLLDITHEKPDFDTLADIVAAYLYHVPFENVSKLYYRKHLGLEGLPSLEQYLDGIEQQHFGGTCYANNFYLNGLLNYLGYTAHLCGADMNDPDVHLVNIVQLDGREYLIDAGYGAPFDHPMPRDLPDDYVIVRGRDRYVLKPQDEAQCSRLKLIRDGKHIHGYRVNPAPRHIDEFLPIILDSYRPESTFLNTLLLVHVFPERSLVVHNFSVIEATGSASTTRTLASREALAAFVDEHFGITQAVMLDVIDDLGDLSGDPWS